MENFLTWKQLGFALIAFAAMSVFTILALIKEIQDLNTIVCTNYSLPASIYPFINNIPIPAVIGIIIDVCLGLLGVFLIVNEKHTKTVESERQDKWKKIVKELSGEDKLLYEIVGNSEGFIYQSELVEKSGMSKVRVTRILDKLEARGLIERKRRGMTNAVTLKFG